MVFASLLLFSIPLQAENISIGVVSISKIMKQAPQAERSSINLKAKFLPIEEKLAEQAVDIKKLKTKITTISAASSPEIKVQMGRKLRALKRAHSRAVEDFREEFRFARDHALDQVQDEVYDAIHIVRQRLGIDIILQEYVSASQRIDITNNVLEYLREKTRQVQLNRNKIQKNHDDSLTSQ
jgi:outer membrane protein